MGNFAHKRPTSVDAPKSAAAKLAVKPKAQPTKDGIVAGFRRHKSAQALVGFVGFVLKVRNVRIRQRSRSIGDTTPKEREHQCLHGNGRVAVRKK
jgi:hypothetical protein